MSLIQQKKWQESNLPIAGVSAWRRTGNGALVMGMQ
jgi:hypothetical protein